MAKRTEKKPVPATEAKPMPKRPRTGIAVRLDMSPRDAERLAKCAEAKGLSKASYARMATLEMIRNDEAEGLTK